MSDKLQQAAITAAKDPDIVEKLDQMLTGENDRAYIVCSFTDCAHNTGGRCTIFALKDVPKMKRTVPCEHYQARTVPSPS